MDSRLRVKVMYILVTLAHRIQHQICKLFSLNMNVCSVLYVNNNSVLETHLKLSGKDSSITSPLLTLTFLSMPLSPVCLQTERFERHFLFARFILRPAGVMELVVCKQLMQPQCQKWWFVIHRWYIIIIWNVTLLNRPALVDVVILPVLGFLWSSTHLHTRSQTQANDTLFPVMRCFFFCLLFSLPSSVVAFI